MGLWDPWGQGEGNHRSPQQQSGVGVRGRNHRGPCQVPALGTGLLRKEGTISLITDGDENKTDWRTYQLMQGMIGQDAACELGEGLVRHHAGSVGPCFHSWDVPCCWEEACLFG